MSPTRVLISDDYPFVRRGLRTILEATENYAIVGEAADGLQTLELATSLRPDVLIMDISMPPPNGLEVAAMLRHAFPAIKILLITVHDTEEMLRAAARTGVSGYLLKSDAEEQLVAALSEIQAGRKFISPAFDPALSRELFT
jgi:DNA-binding NarL/FixJ family response regulator